MTGAANRLGEYLRARRLLADPDALGVPPLGQRRRGVRRQDVAARAGLSVPYLARLEQGRDRHPSDRVVTELGRALGLGPFEIDHLRLLSGHAPVGTQATAHRVRPGLRQLLSSWTEQAAFVQDRFGTVLAANDLAVALCPAFVPGTNVLQWLFLDPRARQCYPDWEHVVRRVVGDVLATSATDPDDAEFCALVDDLTARSADFARLWAQQEVLDKTVGVKRFRTSDGETITLNWECFTVAGDWLFVFFADPHSADQHALMRIKAAGPDQVVDDHKRRVSSRSSTAAPVSGSRVTR